MYIDSLSSYPQRQHQL